RPWLSRFSLKIVRCVNPLRSTVSNTIRRNPMDKEHRGCYIPGWDSGIASMQPSTTLVVGKCISCKAIGCSVQASVRCMGRRNTRDEQTASKTADNNEGECGKAYESMCHKKAIPPL